MMKAIFALAILLLGGPEGALGPQSGKAASIENEWPQYRGPKRDGLSPDKELLKQWPAGGPPLAWKATGIGGGYSSLVVAGNRLYTLGDVDNSCRLIALNAADGKILWSTPLGPAGGHNDYPGPRSTPATDGTFVFALTQNGDLACVQAATGRLVWKVNLESQFGGRMMSGWRWSESPLLDGNFVVVTPGGSKGTVLALHKTNGAPAWQSAQLKDAAAYASLVPVDWGNIRQYIVFTDKSVAGVAARNGQVLWRADRPGETAVIPTPVAKDGIVFVTSGYNVGCNAFQVGFAGGRFTVRELYSGKQMRNHHGGVVLVGDHVYGFDEGILKCIELKTGRELWADRSVGKGAVAYADGHLYCRSENGPIALVEATPEAYREKGRFDQPDRSRRQAWPHPVVFGGKLYIRDQDVLLCYDVREKK
jgi:outer membrane protein assembly factor BamB